MERHLELLLKANGSILAVYEAFGRPGDYGYSTKEGKALAALYDLNNEIVDATANPKTASAEESVIAQ